MNTVAVIPARGGSKGLPRKNIRPLRGKPLLAYMIEAAKCARLVDRVIVSTDDDAIAAVARRWGAEVMERPTELSGDAASSESALLHALEQLEANGEYLPDLLLLLQCTSPFTTPEDIDGTVRALVDGGADSALAVTPFFYFLWGESQAGAFGINHNGGPRQRRQELPPQYLEAGSVYAMRVPAFLAEKTRFCGRSALYVIEEACRCLEIDDAADFYRAETLAAWVFRSEEEKERYRRQGEQIARLPEKLGAVVCDFDGVFTDNAVYTMQNGEECVRSDRGDGAGIAALKKRGVPVLVLSTEQNPVVTSRCRKLGLSCVQGVEDKRSWLEGWLRKQGIAPEQIVYVGNDLNDRECLLCAGMGVVPCDAHISALAAADMVLKSRGGQGALRELSDMLCDQLDSGFIQLL